MSEILIRGMEMPKCGRITIQIGADGAVYLVTEGKITAEVYMECNPAIAVQPHGRLIDADRILSDGMKRMYYHLENGDIAIPIIDIENAPTIIPTSE